MKIISNSWHTDDVVVENDEGVQQTNIAAIKFEGNVKENLVTLVIETYPNKPVEITMPDEYVDIFLHLPIITINGKQYKHIREDMYKAI